MRASGGDAAALTVDVTDPEAVDGAAAHVMVRFGGLHIAVNNAGIVNGGSVEPSMVAVNVLDAIRRRRPYVFTVDHAADAVDARLRAILAARSDVLTV